MRFRRGRDYKRGRWFSALEGLGLFEIIMLTYTLLIDKFLMLMVRNFPNEFQGIGK